jgi:hypothetical protein
MKKYFILTIILLAFTSCKTKSTIDSKTNTENTIASKSAFFKIINKDVSFDQLKINTKIIAETGKFIPPLDATIYIEKDKKVWINMTALFFNVGRGIATPDGIRGYEKWDKTYIESDFTYLNKLLNVNFIDYKAFENLLLGKAFIPLKEKELDLSTNDEGFQLKSTKNLSFESEGKTSTYSTTLQYNPNMNLKKVTLNKINSSDYLEISYDNWENFDNIQIPKNVKIIIKDTKDSQIFLENTKFDRSKMETPYSVPGNYMKTEIK